MLSIDSMHTDKCPPFICGYCRLTSLYATVGSTRLRLVSLVNVHSGPFILVCHYLTPIANRMLIALGL